MARKQTRRSEKPARSGVLSGTIVAVVALVGIDYSLTGPHLVGRSHKGMSVAVGAALPAAAAPRSPIGVSLTLAAGGLALLLLLARRTPTMARVPNRHVCESPPSCPPPLGLIHRRTSISYRTGGLYGP